MIKTLFDVQSDRELSVLCLGAHCDDIEIGCGGTLVELARLQKHVSIKWVVFASTSQRRDESIAAAAALLNRSIDTTFHNFTDGYFPAEYRAIKQQFEGLKRSCNPDIVFTHCSDDQHQDHRTVAEITKSTFRDHAILEYEIPKYDGDLGNPALFVPMTAETASTKARAIVDSHVSQGDKHWFTAETFLSIMRLRGIQCRAPAGYAEAFRSNKLMLSLEHR